MAFHFNFSLWDLVGFWEFIFMQHCIFNCFDVRIFSLVAKSVCKFVIFCAFNDASTAFRLIFAYGYYWACDGVMVLTMRRRNDVVHEHHHDGDDGNDYGDEDNDNSEIP